jgi:hypothetical protein
MLRRGGEPVRDAAVVLAAEPRALQEGTYLDAFDAAVAALTARGLAVILNNHNSSVHRAR